MTVSSSLSLGLQLACLAVFLVRLLRKRHVVQLQRLLMVDGCWLLRPRRSLWRQAACLDHLRQLAAEALRATRGHCCRLPRVRALGTDGLGGEALAMGGRCRCRRALPAGTLCCLRESSLFVLFAFCYVAF